MGTKVFVDENDIVEIPDDLISETSFPVFLTSHIQKLLLILPYIFGVSRSTFYRIFSKDDEIWCEIVAGQPPEGHGIGNSWPIKKKLDILRGVGSLDTKLKNNLLHDPDTEYFIDWIMANHINAILYSSICEGDLRGLIVVDATDSKKTFSEGEVQIFKGTFIGLLHGSRELLLQELRHKFQNPLTVIGAWARRISASIKKSPGLVTDPVLEGICSDADRFASEVIEFEKIFPKTI